MLGLLVLASDPSPLAWLACARGGSSPPCCSCKQLNISRQSDELSRKKMPIWKFGSFPPWICNLVKISCWGKPEGLDSFLQCECFHTKRVSQMLDRWQCPSRKNERKLFNMSDYRLFRNFMWTFAISSCYQIVIYLVHLISNDRRMMHSQFHHPYNSEQGEPDRLYLCCHKLFRRRDFLLH